MKIIESFSLPIPEGSEIKSVKAEFNSNIVTINAQVERKFSPRDGDFLISCKGNTFILNTENNRNGFFGCYAGVTLCGIINLNPRINWTPKEGCHGKRNKGTCRIIHFSMKRIVKGILLWLTILSSITFLCSLEVITRYEIFFVWITLNSIMCFLCHRYISFFELCSLSGYKLIYKLFK